MTFEHLKSCRDLQTQDIANAAEGREAFRLLMARLAEIAAPKTGGEKLLLAIARLGTSPATDWLDGDLRVEFLADGEQTMLEVMTELGGGMRERLFSPMTFRIPFEELLACVDGEPETLVPLSVRAKSPRRLVLTAGEAVRISTVPPPPRILSISPFVKPPIGRPIAGELVRRKKSLPPKD